MGYKKGHKGDEMEGTDVTSAAVGSSSTSWGGSNAGGKAKGRTSAPANALRNLDDSGPFGAPKYGVAKKNEVTK